MATDEIDYLAGELASAKVVSTEKGDALLIAGKVYEVTGPDGNCAELFSRAMRRNGCEKGGITSGVVGEAITLNA